MTAIRDIDPLASRAAAHDVNDLFLRRWSPRAMSGEAVGEAELARLYEAARWAPSSYNEQPWRFLSARRGSPAWDTFFGLLVEGNKAWCTGAGALLLLASKRTFSMDGSANPVHVFDAGAAWQNLALQGAEMGLVIHAMAGFDGDRARAELSIPDDYSVCCMIAVGRPGDTGSLPENLRAMESPSGRKPVGEIAFEGAFPAT